MHICAQAHTVPSYFRERHLYHKNLYVACEFQQLQQTLINSTLRGGCWATETLSPHTERKLDGLFKNTYLKVAPRFTIYDVCL